MSTPEERLAALLRDTDIPVRGDGLSRIQNRLARRRWIRWIAPVAALATAGVAASVLALTGTGDRDTLTVQPADTPPATAEPSPTASPRAGGYDGPALSSYTSTNKDDVVRHWLAAVGIGGQPQQHPCESCDIVPIGIGGVHVGDAALARSYSGGTISYTLVGVGNDEVAVTSPASGATVTSPLTVTGTLTQGVDENVRLTLHAADGTELGQGGAPAGSAQPWSGQVTWTDASWSNGSLVGETFSAKDSSATRLVAVPVVRRSSLASEPTFAGLGVPAPSGRLAGGLPRALDR